MKKGISLLLILMFMIMSFAVSGCNKSNKANKESSEVAAAKTDGSDSVNDDKSSNKGTSGTSTAKSDKGSTGSSTSTNKPSKVSPETLIKDFITKLYTINDYKTIDLDALNTRFPNDSYTGELLKVADENALATIINDRTQLMYVTACMYSHINIKIDSTKVEKYSTAEDGSIIYNYNVKLKLTFPDEKNKVRDEQANGQLALKIIDGNWKITQVYKADMEDIIKKYMNRY